MSRARGPTGAEAADARAPLLCVGPLHQNNFFFFFFFFLPKKKKRRRKKKRNFVELGS
jgi:hypothetical protein